MSFAERPLLVVAIGGNAISPPSGSLSYAEERRAIGAAGAELAELIGHRRCRLLVVHGNGPQVGRLLRHGFQDRDLDVHVAQTQGELGYLLVAALQAASGEPASALMTRVQVDPADPAFEQAEKAIGPVLAARPDGPAVALPRGGGWRQAVASPAPGPVLELAAIRTLLATGHVVAGGGGGVPVDPAGQGVAAVVDKDRLAARLAETLGAQTLLIGTDVPGVFRDFDSEHPELIRRLTVQQTLAGVAAGTYPGGSMGPKIESAARFAAACGRPAVITAMGTLRAGLAGAAGTRIG